MMTVDEAIQILKENRPERPYKTKGRKLQSAIDVVINALKEGEWEYICGDSVETYRCSICGCFVFDDEKVRCPQCHAVMKRR